MISADANPAGPGLVEEPVEAAFAGPHKGRFQPVHSGSHGTVEKGPDLGTMGSLTLVATIWPTMPGAKRRQGILSVYDPSVRRGIALAIGEDGSVEALLGATRVKTRVPLEERQWYRVLAVYDVTAATLTVGQVRLEVAVRRGTEDRVGQARRRRRRAAGRRHAMDHRRPRRHTGEGPFQRQDRAAGDLRAAAADAATIETLAIDSAVAGRHRGVGFRTRHVDRSASSTPDRARITASSSICRHAP